MLFTLFMWPASMSSASGDEPEVGAEENDDVFYTEFTETDEASNSENPTEQSQVVTTSVSETVPPTLIPQCEHGGAVGLDNGFGCTGKQLECEGGLVFTVITHAADGTSTTDTYECIKEEEATKGKPIDIPAEVAKAFRKVGLPTSSLVVQPPGGRTLVNLDTIFSSQAERFTTDVALDPVKITVSLEIWPQSFKWHFGDGSTPRLTDWPGKPWTEGADVSTLITHTYSKVGEKIPVSVDTTWAARWRVKGTDNPWQDVAGTVTIEGTPQQISVLEAKPLLVKR
ncbi:hypothetical protein DDE18_20725 [Nocardioides gansuensis]|uniref:PKD domain-containing protein n=1 Tax=Nocardioides gansuensis TaxID=2138300 RepID=A0A2T8F5J8_9ACTN|nr:hypothetical protein [Nocardioides gansuensis]PVG80984.1 hypothetical protein DDE18_20725 [Nocardioides gansuensis]